MSLKDILLHVDDNEGLVACLNVAVGLASTYSARLTALHITEPHVIPGYVLPEIPPEVIEARRRANLEETERCAAAFRAAVAREGINAEWHALTGPTATILSSYARYTDLVVLGGPSPGEPYNAGTAFPAQVMLAGGRPILLVRPNAAPTVPGKRVLIAWKEGPEAARAVGDAMPFLERAEQVEVAQVVKPGEAPPGDGEELCRYLERHGISASQVVLERKTGRTTRCLLTHAEATSVDLLVMGGYGSSRLSELVLGGVTEHMLRHAPMAVLLSH